MQIVHSMDYKPIFETREPDLAGLFLLAEEERY